jgi:hypothetical protein
MEKPEKVNRIEAPPSLTHYAGKAMIGCPVFRPFPAFQGAPSGWKG